MIELFHGATAVIEKPNCSAGRENLDFGRGFYLTGMSEQAARWAMRISADRNEPPVINVYSLDLEKVKAHYNCLVFSEYNNEWLEFIVSSRTGKCPWMGYDYIEGGVANDRVIDTVNLYSLGLMSSETALSELSKHRPNNQICILNQDIVDKYLIFKTSYNCE